MFLQNDQKKPPQRDLRGGFRRAGGPFGSIEPGREAQISFARNQLNTEEKPSFEDARARFTQALKRIQREILLLRHAQHSVCFWAGEHEPGTHVMVDARGLGIVLRGGVGSEGVSILVEESLTRMSRRAGRGDSRASPWEHGDGPVPLASLMTPLTI
jgi:hypothetical protein